MIWSISDFVETSVRVAMAPRPEVIWIEADKHCGQVVVLCVRSGRSQPLVIGESAGDIIGIVYLKDIVQRTYLRIDGGRDVRVSEVMYDCVFVLDSKPLDDLPDKMQRIRNYIAILIDEYGSVTGLISIEDIFKEIVGEIADEYDEVEQVPTEPLGNVSYRVQARLNLGEFIELYGEAHGREFVLDDEVTDEVDMVSGLLAYGLGRVPLLGSCVGCTGLKSTTESSRDRRGRMRARIVVVEPTTELYSEGEDTNGQPW